MSRVFEYMEESVKMTKKQIKACQDTVNRLFKQVGANLIWKKK